MIMKKILFITILIFASLAGIYAMNRKTDITAAPDRSAIEKLWKEFDSSLKADRPQKQMEILEQIKKMASDQRLPWDFYRACDEYRSTGIYRDWKKQEFFNEQFRKEIKEFNEPVLTFFNERTTLEGKTGFLKENRKVLESGRNNGFYGADHFLSSTGFGPVLAECIENDYQYALWSLMMNTMLSGKPSEEPEAMLKEAIGEKYPDAALLELAPVLRMSDQFRQKESLEKYAERYKEKGVSLLARQELLSIALRKLENDKNSTSTQFKVLREECEAFEKDRKALSSKEKSISDLCTVVDGIIRNLDRKDVFHEIKNDVISVFTRNLDKVEITLKDGEKTVFSKTLNNNIKSYYVLDTLTCTLPSLNDGQYDVSIKYAGKEEKTLFNRYSIAIASRIDAEETAIYLADALTGEPVINADLALIDDKGKVKTEYKGFKLNGFTYLPDEFERHIGKDSRKNILRCSFIDKDGLIHKTDKIFLNPWTSAAHETHEDTYIDILLDRTAFTPDETVHFKVLAYHGDRAVSLKTVDKGRKLTARLFDAEGDEVSTLELTTNEFGSAAGEFLLERRAKNGIYSIEVTDGKNNRNRISLRVDDFVLPTFDLTFDEDDQIHFPGDDIEVRGSLKSYSGHSLSAADIRYSVNESGKILKEGVLELDREGHFAIPFKAEGSHDYLFFTIVVKVTDITGETLSWSKYVEARKSIPFFVNVDNKAEASLKIPEDPVYRPEESFPWRVVSDDVFKISFHTDEQNHESTRASLKIQYTLKLGEKVIAEGNAVPGETIEFDTGAYPSGEYRLEARAFARDVYGNDIEETVRRRIYKIKDNDNVLDFDADCLYKIVEDGRPSIQIGSTTGPVWACVEIFGKDNRLLGSKLVHLEGKKGTRGSITTVHFDWPSEQDEVFMHAVFFKNYTQYTYSHNFTRRVDRLELPLSFTRFEDRTAPHSPYSFEISTLPGVECAATIFDKSTESIMNNRWNKVMLYEGSGIYVYYAIDAGENGAGYGPYMMKSASGAPRMLAKSAVPMADNSNNSIETAFALDYAEAVEEEAIPFQLQEQVQEITVRENFANTIAFEPFLRSDETGKISLNFTTADKLSTYYVQLFAHDKDMTNNVLRREMMVTIPVKVSVVEPQFLYEGDRYLVKAALASSVEKSVSGYLKADFFDGKDYKNSEPIKTMVRKIELGALESLSNEFEIEVPSVKELGILLTFIAEGTSEGSDAVFVSVPVLQAVQTITEAHSGLLRHGESLEALLSSLKSQFVNTSAEGAEMKYRSVLQMVREAIPSKVEAESDNVIALSEAIYVRLLANRLGSNVATSVPTSEIVAKILSCCCNDGGFAWFEGMDSSPVVTAVLLQRYASLKKRGIIDPQTSAIPQNAVENAVKYLDKTYFGDRNRPYWCGGLSWDQYISTRTMFPEVEFSTQGIDSKLLKEFRKDIKEYLTPKKERGLNSNILGKARRMQILLDLSSSGKGLDLAESWGITFGAGNKMLKSLGKDLISVEEYAIEHKSGGWYYPNAVMPFRGLLESEAYAHAFIADLLKDCVPALKGIASEDILAKAGEIAEGIRLWLMVQKETQKWEKDAAFVNALSTILDGSDEVLNLRVISLSKTVTEPLAAIKASGNGFVIERRFFMEKTEGTKNTRVELSEGDALNVGDKVIAEYRIWNEENRSFVKISAPRMASLRPVNQLSGQSGWGLKPLSIAGWHAFTPHGYRNVLKDRTEYWFDSYPEENSTITEEFYVTQAGAFQMAAMEIESLYAPHYRANGDGQNPVTSK